MFESPITHPHKLRAAHYSKTLCDNHTLPTAVVEIVPIHVISRELRGGELLLMMDSLLSTVYCLLSTVCFIQSVTIYSAQNNNKNNKTNYSDTCMYLFYERRYIHVCKYNSTLRYTHTFFNFKQYISINIRFLFHLFVFKLCGTEKVSPRSSNLQEAVE